MRVSVDQTGVGLVCYSWLKRELPDLRGELERIDLVALLAQRVVHAAQVVAHHAQLIFVAPLGGAELILVDNRSTRHHISRLQRADRAERVC